MESRKKILTISTSGFKKRDGIAAVILDNYKLLNKDMYDIDFICESTIDESVKANIKDINANIKILPHRPSISYFLALLKLMKKKKYDIIYIHGSSSIMALELLIAKIAGCKKRVVHSHNTISEHPVIDWFLRPLFYLLYSDALACGEAAGRWLYKNKPFTIIKNGRDTSVYTYNEDIRQKVRKKLGISDGMRVIGHVGNFNKQKNHEFIIQIAKETLRTNDNVIFLLVGSGTTKNRIEKSVKEYNLTDKFIFTGNVNNVSDILQSCDVMILPSLYEGVPLVVVEWQMNGLKCVISDKVSRECVFTDNVKFMSLEDTPQHWLNALMAKLPDREKSSKLAITRASDNGFDLKNNSLILEKIFR